MQRKSPRLSRLLALCAALPALWSAAGCSTGPCADYDRVRGIVIKGRGAEPPVQSAPDSLALTPTGESVQANQ
jgi:hypothetical protein